MSIKITVQMHLERDTKNTHKYIAQASPGGVDPLVSAFYIRKSAFPDGAPRIIQLIVTVPTEEDIKT